MSTSRCTTCVTTRSVVASTWPSILATDKPIMHLGFGTPDLITLMKRLPGDKVPMLMSTAMVGLVWKPNGWHFSFRPTYSHEFVGLLNHLQQKKGGKLTIGAISTQTAAGFVDQVKGVQKFAETNPDRFAVLDVQWVDASPVSVVNEVRTLVRQQPDVILVGGTTAQVVATGKALRELGANIPIIMSTHNGLTEVAKGIDLKEIEGSYSVFRLYARQPGGPAGSRPLYEVSYRRRQLGHRRRAVVLSGVAGAARARTGHRQERQGRRHRPSHVRRDARRRL